MNQTPIEAMWRSGMKEIERLKGELEIMRQIWLSTEESSVKGDEVLLGIAKALSGNDMTDAELSMPLAKKAAETFEYRVRCVKAINYIWQTGYNPESLPEVLRILRGDRKEWFGDKPEELIKQALKGSEQP
jgi:hypothetical protein